MTEQAFDELEEKANKQLGENSVVDMIIGGKQSIDDVISSVPRTPNVTYQQNIESIDKELSEFEKRYNGLPATKSQKKVEGNIARFIKKANKSLFGGYEEVVKPGKPGLQEQGLTIYESGVKSLDAAMKELPEIRKGIRLEENYLAKVEKHLKEHANIFFTCESKKKEILTLKEGFQQRYESEQTDLDEKRAISGYIKKLDQKEKLVDQTMRNVESRAIVYKQNKNYVAKQISINQEQVSSLETRIATKQANLEAFKLQVDTLPVNQQFIKATRSLNEANKKIREQTNKVHEAYIKSAEISREALAQNPDIDVYNNDMYQDIASQDEQLQDASKVSGDEMYARAKTIFLSLE